MKQGRDNYSRMYDLLTLINSMRCSMAGLSYDDIQDKFKWTRRTAERMLKLIENHYWRSFVKTRGNDNKMYFRLSSDDRFPPNSISENEIIALKTALGFVKSNELLQLPLESLAGKLEAMKSGGQNNIEDMTLASGTASAPRPYIKCDRKIIETLQEAILACRIVKIKYKQQNGVITPLTVCPQGFLYGVHNNYLVACYIDKNDYPKHYILNQLQSVKLTSTVFDAKGFNIHEYAKKSFGAFITHGGGYKVKWKVKPEAAPRAKKFIFHPTQKLTEMKDGGLIVEFFADGLKEMVWHLMTWEGMIKPIAPKELVEEFEKQVGLAAGVLK